MGELRSGVMTIRIKPSLLDLIKSKTTKDFSQSDLIEEAVMRHFLLLDDADIDLRGELKKAKRKNERLNEVLHLVRNIRNDAQATLNRIEEDED